MRDAHLPDRLPSPPRLREARPTRLRHSVAAVLVAVVAVAALTVGSCVEAARDTRGDQVYRILKQQRLLEDYMPEAMDDIMASLIAATGQWDGFRINRPYRQGLVNVYMVDTGRLRDRNPLAELEIPIDGLAGNALADEVSGILLVDTGLLKSFVTAAILYATTEMDTLAAVGAISARGIDAFRDIWDPKRNRALLSADYTTPWVQYASGAAAFLLAHEMGHLAIGRDDPSRRLPPMRFASKADRDLLWACPDLIQRKYAAIQALERAADDFAVELLSQITFPPGVLTEPMLRYEVGANWYIVYSIGNQMVRALSVTNSPFIRQMLQVQFGPEVFAMLDANRTDDRPGSVQVFFPETHPANIRRAHDSLKRLEQSPYSVARFQPSTSAAKIAMFELFVQAECRDLKDRYGGS